MIEPVELHEELNRHIHRGRHEKEWQVLASWGNALLQCNWQQSQAREQKSVQQHVPNAHFIERQPAEVEASAPEASGRRERQVWCHDGLINNGCGMMMPMADGGTAKSDSTPAGSFGSRFVLHVR